jgi:uncharacterized protein (DUF983 family)
MSGAAGARRSTAADRVAIPAPVGDAIRGVCPRCGKGALFGGLTAFASACTACGLDYTRFNVGDGPAAFLTLIVGAVVVLGAVSLELAASPPFWVHLLIWPALTLVLVIAGLRIAKAWLLTSEYRNAAREGRIAE